jgi:hypothetical protein
MNARLTDSPLDLAALRAMTPKALRAVLAAGHSIDPTALDDTAYRGVSLGIPRWVERLAWTTFVKTFHRDPETGDLRGWNVRLKQTGLDGPVEPMRVSSGAPKTFGHFRVVGCEGLAPPKGADGGLMIHYGLGGNAPWDGIRFLRDPIVALSPGSVDRLLGWSYLDLGFRCPTPSYFLLERLGPLDHHASPPRS